MDDDWIAPWRCPWTGKQDFTFAPDFSGLDPDTGEPWSPRKVVELLGMKVLPAAEVRQVCEDLVQENPDKVQAYRAGKKQLLGFFMKLVMDRTQKRADPKDASKILQELLES